MRWGGCEQLMLHCKIPACTVSIDGRCLEGRGVNCPNLLPEDAPAATVDASLESVETAELQGSIYPETESLFSGLPLEVDEAREFSQQGRAIVVSMAGMSESGKTSLIARL